MSHNNTEKPINRRQEQRMPLQGLDLKIKKIVFGLTSNFQHYEKCRLVDLSINGLAFSTDTLELKALEKVDFTLHIEEHEITGTGVICNKRENDSGRQYGLMFLSVTPEISTVFHTDDLSTAELKSLSENLAEQFVSSIHDTNSPDRKLLHNKQQQLFDAFRYYLIRLGEMGVRMPSLQAEKLIHPIQAVKIFRETDQTLLLRWHNCKTKQTDEMTVAIQPEVLRASFLVNKQRCKTVLQVVDYLGQKIKEHIQFI